MSPGNAAHAETHAPKAAPAKHDKRRQRSPSTADMSTGAFSYRGSAPLCGRLLTLTRAATVPDAAFDLRRMSTREAGEKARRGAAEQQGSDSRHAVAASDARRGLATLRLSAQGTLEYRVHFTYDAAPMSPWCAAAAGPRPEAPRTDVRGTALRGAGTTSRCTPATATCTSSARCGARLSAARRHPAAQRASVVAVALRVSVGLRRRRPLTLLSPLYPAPSDSQVDARQV